jgi:hypothetical protein
MNLFLGCPNCLVDLPCQFAACYFHNCIRPTTNTGQLAADDTNIEIREGSISASWKVTYLIEQQ